MAIAVTEPLPMTSINAKGIPVQTSDLVQAIEAWISPFVHVRGEEMTWMFPHDGLGKVTEANKTTAAPSPSADGGLSASLSGADSSVLACVDNLSSSEFILMHSLAIARSLKLSVTLARVLEAQHSTELPADPIEWQMRLVECREGLNQLVSSKGPAFPQLQSVILAGPAADELSRWAKDRHVALIVLATTGLPLVSGKTIGATALSVLRQTGASVLLVPPVHDAPENVSYKRVIVPLDGSLRAESVLPIAIRIARDHGAELVLATAVPRTYHFENLVIDAKAGQLCERLDEHNEQSAHNYIENLRGRFASENVSLRGIVKCGGDPRQVIRQLVIEQHADLVVMSSHGKTGLSDVPIGSVAEYMATHAPAPLLILRSSIAEMFHATETREEPMANSVSVPV